MTLILKNYFHEFCLFWILNLLIVTDGCFFLPPHLPLYYHHCEANFIAVFVPYDYEQCLRCYITSSLRESINDSWRGLCELQYNCIELRFYNMKTFEFFFKNYYYRVQQFFKISLDSEISNTLSIMLRRDHYQTLNLTYIQSLVKSNGVDYSYLLFILCDTRKQILLDLETGLLNIPLKSILIRISCSKTIVLNYTISPRNQSLNHSNSCVKIISNSTGRYSTSTTSTNSSIIIHKKTKKRLIITNLFLFITSLIFLFCILFIFLNLCVRYDRLKDNDDYVRRSSTVSSTISADSFDTTKDEIFFSQRIT